jgi:hypothetical protein
VKKQKVTFELDKELDTETQDEIIYLLRDIGAKNIEIDWDEGCIKEVTAIGNLTQLSKEETEDGRYSIG